MASYLCLDQCALHAALRQCATQSKLCGSCVEAKSIVDCPSVRPSGVGGMTMSIATGSGKVSSSGPNITSLGGYSWNMSTVSK